MTTDAGVPELDGAPLFLLDELPDADELLVDGAEGRHAVEVLRLTPGERVRLGNGRGAVAEGDVLAAGVEGLRVAVRARFDVPAPDPEFVLVQALPKGDRGPLAVDLATELGVDRIVPWAAARCVTRWRDDRVEKGLAKWRSAARAASKQSRRPRVPEVTGPMTTRVAPRHRPRGRAARAGPPSPRRAADPADGDRRGRRRPGGRPHRR
jgi:16S rRNA (uracil1498-N3)-methyltransferase